jgi:subtilisin family serine protease
VYQSRYPSGVTKNGGVELMAQAIISAIDDYHCKVLCISSGINSDDAMLKEAVFYAEKKGVVIVAAVGNDNEKNPEKTYYPAAYDTVISIGAVNDNDEIAEFSQRHGVFAVERGKNITALTLDGTMKEFSGTSYANARAVGIVAALLSAVPDSSPEDIRISLALSAKDLGDAGYDSVYGWGKINAAAALNILNNKNNSDNSKIPSETSDTGYLREPLFILDQKLLYRLIILTFFTY